MAIYPCLTFLMSLTFGNSKTPSSKAHHRTDITLPGLFHLDIQEWRNLPGQQFLSDAVAATTVYNCCPASTQLHAATWMNYQHPFLYIYRNPSMSSAFKKKLDKLSSSSCPSKGASFHQFLADSLYASFRSIFRVWITRLTQFSAEASPVLCKTIQFLSVNVLKEPLLVVYTNPILRQQRLLGSIGFLMTTGSLAKS